MLIQTGLWRLLHLLGDGFVDAFCMEILLLLDERVVSVGEVNFYTKCNAQKLTFKLF